MIIYGGKNETGSLLKDVMILDMGKLIWFTPKLSGIDPGAR